MLKCEYRRTVEIELRYPNAAFGDEPKFQTGADLTRLCHCAVHR